jgi:hypothetical protein
LLASLVQWREALDQDLPMPTLPHIEL